MEIERMSPGEIALATVGLVTGALITGVIIVLRGGNTHEIRAEPLEIKWPIPGPTDDEEFPLAI
jgi:Na+/glutamate symporter